MHRLDSDSQGRVSVAEYFDREDQRQRVTARVFVVACQAIETARLLLHSSGPRHPNGLGNGSGQVGRDLVFSAGGSGTGDFPYAKVTDEQVRGLKVRGPFVNRALQDWYFFEEAKLGGRAKGGIIEFLFRHPNPIARANALKWDGDLLVWGEPLKQRLKAYFTEARYLRFEVFNDWLPTDDCFVTLDPKIKDKWGTPVAKVRVGHHPHDLKVGRYLSAKAEAVLRKMGAENVRSSVSGSPAQNLVAGGCRFGDDPKTSVLDRDCRAHEVQNLYVTDGSFMPTGGSVPYTWTIYANAFRVAERIAAELPGQA